MCTAKSASARCSMDSQGGTDLDPAFNLELRRRTSVRLFSVRRGIAMIVSAAAVVALAVLANGDGGGSAMPSPVAATRNPDQAPEMAIPERRVAANGKSFGRMPTRASAEQAFADAPDFIAVLTHDGSEVAGYLKKTDMASRINGVLVMTTAERLPVYSADGEYVVGSWVSGWGFVPQ